MEVEIPPKNGLSFTPTAREEEEQGCNDEGGGIFESFRGRAAALLGVWRPEASEGLDDAVCDDSFSLAKFCDGGEGRNSEVSW